MNVKKQLVRWILTVLMVSLGCILMTIETKAQTKGHLPSSSEDTGWLDATDETLFGMHALQKDSLIDQSENLQRIIDDANTRTQKIYIPSGTYILNKNVTLRSGIKLKGDATTPSILKNTTGVNVVLSDENYHASQNIAIHQLFFDGVGIFTRLANEITINDNIFYHPVSLYPINLQTSNGAILQNNIFMRDHEHASPDTENRAIYIGGFSTIGRYEYIENVQITDNLFGLKINELDAIKSFSNVSIIQTIDRLQTAIRAGHIQLAHNEQNYLSCGVNSYSNAKNVLIKNNFFQQMYENEDRHDVVGDHAIYLRGSQEVQVIGNHVRGLQNGPYGGFKFKSGREITIMNNYLRNTGLILYETPEFGLGDSFAQGQVAELSNWLVANNVFDFKEWQDKFAIGIEYNRHTGIDNVFNGVFIDNHFVNYHNIPANRRRELLIMNNAFEGFKGDSTFVSGNTRDDTPDGVLNVEFWSSEEYTKMPTSWENLIDPTKYEEYKETPIPIRNTFPIGRTVELILGSSYHPFDFVDQTHDADEEKPTIEMINPEVLTKVGQHQLELLLTYSDGRELRVFSEVTIVSPSNEKDPESTMGKTVNTKGQITFLPSSEELVIIPPETSPEVVIPPEVPGVTGPLSIVKAISMDFGRQVISTKDHTYEMIAELAELSDGSGKIPYVSFVQVQDLRGTNEGWSLNLSLSDFTSKTRNNVLKGAEILLIDPRVHYEGSNEANAPISNKQEIDLKPNTGTVPLMTAPSGTGAGTSSFVLGNQRDLEDQMLEQTDNGVKNTNILLTVPGRTEADATIYRSTLTWELGLVPDGNGPLSI
ncbi:WxL domain-containing protein [Enterococcus casseliflavus]|uniref:WxL domain-containing protein n=1 Tax=Enterococcus casseliflavus TaxID=37734 RepID=UPI00232E52FB|nr:WxL domain-containing protein [Enterococcus casseliflavus]MDB1689565.1 WxL domain-containing protein [Enterococcus casseliflavus]